MAMMGMRGIGYCPVGCMNVCCRPGMTMNPMMQTQTTYVNNQAMYQNQQQAGMMQQQARMQQ